MKRKDAPGFGALASEGWIQMPAPALLVLFVAFLCSRLTSGTLHQVPSLPHQGAGRINNSEGVHAVERRGV